MKILSTNFSQNMRVKNQIASRPLFEQQKDTFVKSSPSFKGVEQKAAAQGAKTLLELGAFTAVVYAAFKKLTGGSDDIKDVNLENINNPFIDFVNQIVGQKNEEIKKLEEENTRLKQENEELKANGTNTKGTTGAVTEEQNTTAETEQAVEPDSAALPEQEIGEADNPIIDATEEGNIGAEETQGSEEQIQNETEEEIQYAEFPTKRGIMSVEQKILKTEVIKISISPEYNKKLTAICQDILKKGAKDKENKQRMLDLAAELRECNGDKEKLKAVVDKYGEGIIVPQSQDVTNSEIKENDKEEQKPEQKENNNSDEVYDPVAKRTLPGTTVVGSIDLSKMPGRKSARPRIERGHISGSSISASTSDNTGSSAAPKPATEAVLEQSAAPVVSSGDVITEGAYTYNKPGTVPLDTKKNLTDALGFFEEQFLADKKQEAKENGTKREYVQWMYRRPVGRVQRDDVVNEVDKCRTRGPLSKYYNINRNNAEAVAEAINDEPKFKDLFTFHGAAKFVERLVDFNSDEPIEEQASRGLGLLEETLQKALKSGVVMEEHDDVFTYKDKDGTVHKELHKGTNIIIPAECYSEEAKQMFGSYPLKLGICRAGKYSQKALICTVYPKGVY